jgi:hypothetical protein
LSSTKGIRECININETIRTISIFQVWCINGSTKTALPKEELGKFYSGDCYIVLYTYHSGDKKEEFYLTYWIGKHSLRVIIVSVYKCLRHSSNSLTRPPHTHTRKTCASLISVDPLLYIL